ncbi:hypothetical protein M3Y94_00268500 [Aphelenchoides besseyi]|nr:hypothetical protein M3Y94_00268500 [Aphelenchoides besseyi]KAI6236105.1 hypothetical protein M3Y95_00122400 [Aphelenchoides besseyi]
MPSESTLTRSNHTEHLELCPINKNDHVEDPAVVGDLHDFRFFDSTDYRFCCKLHAKVLAFAVCTVILHEVIIAELYVLKTEFKEGNSSLYILLICRTVQIPSLALFYVGLWRYQPKYVLPFVMVQCSVGIFADISTLLLLIRELEHQNAWLPFEENYKWLNILLPLFLYFLLVGLLLHIVHRCYKYLIDRARHDEMRRLTKEREQLKETALNGNDSTTIALAPTQLAPQKTQNAIAIQSLRRTPSSQISRASKFSAQQLQLRRELINQQNARRNLNPTGSLQQLPSSAISRPSVSSSVNPLNARRLMSLSNSPYQPPNYDQSEPALSSMFVK